MVAANFFERKIFPLFLLQGLIFPSHLLLTLTSSLRFSSSCALCCTVDKTWEAWAGQMPRRTAPRGPRSHPATPLSSSGAAAGPGWQWIVRDIDIGDSKSDSGYTIVVALYWVYIILVSIQIPL